MSKTFYDIIIGLPQHRAFIKNKEKYTGTTSQLVFDLKNKIIKCGNFEIFNNGILPKELSLTDGTVFDLAGIELIRIESRDQYEVIEHLYEIYYRSVPNKYSIERNSNFRALPVNDLSYEEVSEGIPRISAKYMLEGYILLASFCGAIQWKYPENFFWQSKKNKSLVLFREWIKGELK